MNQPLPAKMLAAYDQAHASCVEILDAMIQFHREMCADGEREVDTVALAMFLDRDIKPRTVAELLATAIDRLAHQ